MLLSDETQPNLPTFPAHDDTLQMRRVRRAIRRASQEPSSPPAPTRRERLRKMARSARTGLRRAGQLVRWDDIWPAVVGIVLGSGLALGILICGFLIWWDMFAV